MTDSPPPPCSASERDAGELAMLDAVVSSIVETRRAVAALQAFEAGLLASAATLAEQQMARVPSQESRERELPLRSIAAELGAATRSSDRTIQRRMNESHVLVTRFPSTFAAFTAGRIERAHVGVIVDAGHAIDDDEARREYESAAIHCAERETPGRLRPIVRVLAETVNPRPLTIRHAEAAAARAVIVRDLDDGMADLILTVPAILAHGIHDRISQLAREIISARAGVSAAASAGASAEAAARTLAARTLAASNGAEGTAPATAAAATITVPTTATATPTATATATGDGIIGVDSANSANPPTRDTRTMAQLRADILCDLALTGHASPEDSESSIPASDAIRAHVRITIPAAALADSGGSGAAQSEGASIVGHGPLDLATARDLAGRAPGWDRLFTHPVTGTVLAVDRYRPSEAQRRLLSIRDEHCRFPGCRMPSSRCDIDHTNDRQFGGETDVRNLAHLCRRHHVLKHNSHWRVRHRTGGVLEWTSPTGRVYPDMPARTAWFTEDDHDPPPF